ncbi:MAG: cation:dicarboxylase symporter family transporter, partial [Gemmatimonadota bacterium]|nr:cation:dicarboxylase symporter family transporter [Gemmatimonadota bacterium]
MSLSVRVLIGLGLGLAGGIAISAIGIGAALPGLVEPVGTLWVNAIRMTVIPLIVSLLVVAIAGGRESRLVATLGARTLGLFLVMIGAVCLLTAIAAPPLLSLFTIDPETSRALRESTEAAAAGEVTLPPFRDWLVGLIPSNPVQAAAEGAILPLVVFTALFAFALGRVPEESRAGMLGFFRAVKDAMFVLIEWILAVAPIGVFALVLPLAARMGASAAGALGWFLLVACGLIVIALAALYPLATIAGRVPLAGFARALAPVQALGFSTRSSLATLPAMFVATEELEVPDRTAGLVLPIAVSTFKFASPIARATGTYFIAALYGIQLGPVEIAVIAGAIGLLSFYSPGVPSG